MFDYLSSKINQVSAHRIGNKSADENIYISDEPLILDDEKLEGLLSKYFISHFNIPEYFAFTFSNNDVNMNPLFQYVSSIFDHPESFHLQSINIAKHLYECSVHPNIKAGDFYVAHFSHFAFEGELLEAVGLFKSETKDDFIQLNAQTKNYFLKYDQGVNINKLDKGCIIFNTNREAGYRICIIDRSNKLNEAQYWKDNFLNIKPCRDAFHQTKNFLSLTKDFVTKQLGQEFEVSKAEQVDYLNKSIDFFKKNDQFEETNFEKNVFNQPDVISSFQRFKEEYKKEAELELESNFAISDAAVKKQNKVFKSVLKLDKNFHIYIHGNKDLIEQGVDQDGRKYYKIYFKEEH